MSSSIRCPQCGLVNWATSAECKRCARPLDGAAPFSPSYASASGGAYAHDTGPFTAQYTCPVCRRPSLAGFCRYCQPGQAAGAFDADEPAAPQYPSIGGWLILPAVGLVLSPLVLLFQIFRLLSVQGTPEWDARTTPGTAQYVEGLAGFATVEIFMNGLLLAFVLYVAYNFFSKKKKTPALMITFLVLSLVVAVVDASISASLLGDAAGDKAFVGLGRQVVPKAIWLLYFLRSKRVKGTFVN